MKVKCRECGEITEAEMQLYDELSTDTIPVCSHCGSYEVQDYLDNQLDFLSSYCEELERNQWGFEKLLESFEERLDELERIDLDDKRDELIEYIQHFVYQYMECHLDELIQ